MPKYVHLLPSAFNCAKCALHKDICIIANIQLRLRPHEDATFHVTYGKFLSYNILVSFCLSHRAAGNKLDICLKHKFELSDNFDLLHHPNPCSDKNAFYCLSVLRNHYEEVGHEVIEKRRKLDWRSLQTAEELARQVNCD